jgi:hypothetical protein
MGKYYSEDGKVGVLIHAGWGSGFAIKPQSLRMDAELIYEFLHGDEKSFHKQVMEMSEPTHNLYEFDNMRLSYVTEGLKFYVREYDGYEDIVTEEDLKLKA